MIKVIDQSEVVEGQPFGVSIPLEQPDNPFLLFGGQQSFSIVIAVVVAVAAKILLHAVTQLSLMPALDIGKQGVEPPRHVCRLPHREETAAVLLNLHCRIDGWSPVTAFRQMACRQMSQTLLFLRTLTQETQLPPFGHVPEIKFQFCFFHNADKDTNK